MIEFMIVTAPRSASTWAANWLTTDTTICVHEPLWHCHYADIEHLLRYPGRMIGISETGIAKFPDFVNVHPSRKVILHRELKECSDSLVALGFNELKHWEGVLEKIEGRHHHWKDLFDPAKARGIYEYLLQREFDADRHRLLCGIEMQPHFAGMEITAEMKAAAKRLLLELRGKS